MRQRIDLLDQTAIVDEEDIEDNTNLFGADFEIFGDFTSTQGYFNKRFIVTTGFASGCTGWCEDSPHGSVRGYVEGRREHIELMRFLTNEKEVPVPNIDKTVFAELMPIEKRETRGFGFIHEISTPETREFFRELRPDEHIGYGLKRETETGLSDKFFNGLLQWAD